jgi:hypothetical protein
MLRIIMALSPVVEPSLIQCYVLIKPVPWFINGVHIIEMELQPSIHWTNKVTKPIAMP